MSRIYYPQARAILSVVFDGFGPTAKDTPPKVIPVLPKSVTVTRNAYNQADGWECIFDADDFPVDPEMVRAGAIEIFLFATLGIRDGDGSLIDRRDDVLEQPGEGRDRGAVDTVLSEMNASTDLDRFTFGNTPMIAGLFDDQSMELSPSGRWVTISGQDYTALLIANQWPPTAKGRARRIPIGSRLDKVLADILSEADDTGRLNLLVENVGSGNLPTVRSELRSQRRGIAVEQDTSYWDVMSKMASRYGFILFVRGLDVVLTTPQNLDSDKDRRIRRMAWGRNIENLQLTRHLGKETTPAVVIKAYDPSLRQPITVDFPVGSFSRARARAGSPSGNLRPNDEYVIIPVYGVTNRKTLALMAEARYTQLGRSERQVTLSTRDMTDLEDADIMDLASGDAVSVEFDEFNIDRALLSNPNIADEVKFQHLTDRGYGDAIARVIATKYDELAALKRPLRVREVTYEYDSESGMSIEAVLEDFIVIDGARDAPSKKARKNRIRRTKSGDPVAPAARVLGET